MELDIFRTIVLILKDAIRFLLRSFIASILIAVCMQNGWIFNPAYEVSHEMFWQIYGCLIPIIVMVMFYKGIAGQYSWQIQKIHITESSVQEKGKQAKHKIKLGFR